LDIKRILEILPHRYPFLLVDKIVDYNIEEKWVVGLKNVTMNEAFFQGHFPGAPIFPGVLMLEALAQTGGVLVHLLGKDQGKIAVLLNITDAKFRTPVGPGDQLHLHCEGIHTTPRAGKVKAEAKVGDKVAVQATISFALVDKSQI
jgi:3-hydroxyacyl-[acyl-carrier-protein] dehydratase